MTVKKEKNKLKKEKISEDILKDIDVDEGGIDDEGDNTDGGLDDDINTVAVDNVDASDITVDVDEDEDTVYFKFGTTKHKMEGKHRLKRDTIFHGKLDDEEEDMYSSHSDYYNKDFPIEKGTMFEMESRNHEELEEQRRLKKRIYQILSDNTDLDFTSNRRKPNKQAFNNYFEMLLDDLHDRYTKSEIFVELSYYFTDHIFNMYKLLYPEHATSIIMELKNKGYLNELDDMRFV